MARIQCSFQDHSGLMEAQNGRWDLDLEFREWRHVVKGEQREETEDWIQAMMCKNKALVIDRTRILNFFLWPQALTLLCSPSMYLKACYFVHHALFWCFICFPKIALRSSHVAWGSSFSIVSNGDGSTTGPGTSPSHRCSPPPKKKALKLLWLILITDILGIVFNFVPT